MDGHKEELKMMVVKYLDGRLCDQQIASLDNILAREPEARALFWSVAKTHTALNEHFQCQKAAGIYGDQGINDVLGEMLDYEQRLEHHPRALTDQEVAFWGFVESPSSSAQAAESTTYAHEAASVPERSKRILELGPLQVRLRPGLSDQRRNARWPVLKPLAWAACLMMAAGVLMILMSPIPEADRPAPAATLIGSVDPQWGSAEAGEASVPSVGEALAAREHTLASGYIKLRTTRGTHVVIEGPATFNLSKADEMQLQRGRIVARTTQQRETFTVATPSARVTDLGTEFGVNVDANGRTQSSVFEGIAQMLALHADPGNTASPVRIEAGHTGTTDERGEVTVQASNELRGVAERFARDLPDPASPPRPVAGWPYDTDLLDAFAEHDPTRVVGDPILSSDDAPFAYDGAGSLVLDGQSTGISYGTPATLVRNMDAITVSAWIKPEAEHRQHFLNRWADGDRAWQIRFDPLENGGREGRMHVLLSRDGSFDRSETFDLRFAEEMALGQWHHVAFTWQSGQQPRVYLNGQRQEEPWINTGRDTLPEKLHEGFAPLMIGQRADGGNHFEGRLSDVAIWDRKLDDTQIRWLAEHSIATLNGYTQDG